jgi:hypothetical protein
MDSLASIAQTEFLQRGGGAMMGLRKLRDSGQIPEVYAFIEFPKALSLSLGIREIDFSTETVKGTIARWTEKREVFASPVVASEAEEEATLEAFRLASELDIEVAPEWTAQQLRETVARAEKALKAKNAPKSDPQKIKADRIAALKAELAALGADAAEDAAAPRKRPRPAAELPVVAPDPVA